MNTNFPRFVLFASFINKDGSRSSTDLSLVANKRLARSSNVLKTNNQIKEEIIKKSLPSTFHSKG